LVPLQQFGGSDTINKAFNNNVFISILLNKCNK